MPLKVHNVQMSQKLLGCDQVYMKARMADDDRHVKIMRKIQLRQMYNLATEVLKSNRTTPHVEKGSRYKNFTIKASAL